MVFAKENPVRGGCSDRGLGGASVLCGSIIALPPNAYSQGRRGWPASID